MTRRDPGEEVGMSEIETMLRRQLVEVEAEEAVIEAKRQRIEKGLAAEWGCTWTEARKRLRGEAQAEPAKAAQAKPTGPGHVVVGA